MTDDGTGPSPPAANPLQQLLAVQEHDMALDRLRHRRAHLPELAELAVVDKELAAIGTSMRAQEAEQAVLAGKQAELEHGIDAAAGRIVTIEHQLYHGAGVAFRDQEAMAAEVKALQERQSRLEDDELEVMEALEPVEGAIAALRERRDAATVERDRLRGAIAEAEGVIDGEIAAVGTARAHVTTGLPSELAAEYDRLRAKLGGVGVARLAGASCSGCHLTLPATELDRIRHATAGARFHCDQCGRLLVP